MASPSSMLGLTSMRTGLTLTHRTASHAGRRSLRLRHHHLLHTPPVGTTSRAAAAAAAATTGRRCYYHKGAAGVGGAKDGEVYRVDLRSDTLTMPSDEMRKAMADAAVGDDVYGEDPTVNDLQNKMAELFGKEGALFVPTGTMGNLIAVMAHCHTRGLEALMGDRCHIHLYEQGGIAQIGGVHPRTMPNLSDGTFDLNEVRDYVRPLGDVHFPVTRLICVENTHNYCGGKVLPLEFLAKVRALANEFRLSVHLDGARVMNAAVALGVPPSEILQYADSVSMCFSKGLGAPIGSIVAGSDEFMAKARRLRKALGGGMRQVGVLAAAALVGVDTAVERLQHDHACAQKLAQAINAHGQGVVSVDMDGVHTNIVMMDVLDTELEAEQLCHRLNTVTEEEYSETKEPVSVSTLPFAPRLVRMVTSSNISDSDVQLAVNKFKYVFSEFASRRALSNEMSYK